MRVMQVSVTRAGMKGLGSVDRAMVVVSMPVRMKGENTSEVIEAIFECKSLSFVLVFEIYERFCSSPRSAGCLQDLSYSKRDPTVRAEEFSNLDRAWS